MSWIAVIGAVVQLIFLIMNNQFNKSAEDKKRKEDLHAQLSKAIKDRDTDSITAILDKLRI